MVSDRIDVILRGDSSGNNMIVRARLSSGRHIYGFATENFYGGDWDLGPTWNYLVTAKRPFLVDAGRRGKGRQLVELIEFAGFRARDIDAVILSHGHEDHVGGIFELMNIIEAPVMAHEVYGCLVRANAGAAPSVEKAAFPASCWCCPMPENYYERHCLEFNRERQGMSIADIGITGEAIPGVEVFHTPGHCPDSVCLLIDGEAILTGDTILPEITPLPTLESDFHVVKPVLPGKWEEAQQLFGLRAYIRSLRRLKTLALSSDGILVLPAHRLYYRDRWNELDLKNRIEELVQHHIERCRDFMRILRTGPKTPRELATEHFQPDLLTGYGINLALNEVKSHCELMEISQDVVIESGKASSIGSENFSAFIHDLLRSG